jgi:hypothetical protein
VGVGAARRSAATKDLLQGASGPTATISVPGALVERIVTRPE